MPRSGESRSAEGCSSRTPTAIVVGAGVSGCACAAILADSGVRVTLVNSALDRVNLPAYGPELVAGPKGWREIEEIMVCLPLPLRRAWLSTAAVPESGAPVVIVDRRAVSIETKRALERMAGLSLRQGLVTDLGLEYPVNEDSRRESKEERPGGATVGTVFGERFGADALILAVGLGLGGAITVGEDSLHGGRYGETPADGLRNALEALGVTFSEAVLQAGACFVGNTEGLFDSLADRDARNRRQRTISIRRLVEVEGAPGSEGSEAALDGARRVAADAFPSGLPTGFSGGDGQMDDAGVDDRSRSLWPESFPPAVHWSETQPVEQIVIRETDDEGQVPLVSCDGRATGEIHLYSAGVFALRDAGANDGEVSRLEEQGLVASRLNYVVRAKIVQSLGPEGRLIVGSGESPPVWVVGRAAGASSYLSSLRSGALTGAAVARILVKGHREEQEVGGSARGMGTTLRVSGQVSTEPAEAQGRGSTT